MSKKLFLGIGLICLMSGVCFAGGGSLSAGNTNTLSVNLACIEQDAKNDGGGSIDQYAGIDIDSSVDVDAILANMQGGSRRGRGGGGSGDVTTVSINAAGIVQDAENNGGKDNSIVQTAGIDIDSAVGVDASADAGKGKGKKSSGGGSGDVTTVSINAAGIVQDAENESEGGKGHGKKSDGGSSIDQYAGISIDSAVTVDVAKAATAKARCGRQPGGSGGDVSTLSVNLAGIVQDAENEGSDGGRCGRGGGAGGTIIQTGVVDINSILDIGVGPAPRKPRPAPCL